MTEPQQQGPIEELGRERATDRNGEPLMFQGRHLVIRTLRRPDGTYCTGNAWEDA